MAWAAQTAVKYASKLEVAHKVPEKHPKKRKLRDPKSQRARLASCHGLRFPQGLDLLFPEPKPVTPFCDPFSAALTRFLSLAERR
jgi:hypothetical protein